MKWTGVDNLDSERRDKENSISVSHFNILTSAAMTLLRKLINLSGCAKINKTNEKDIIDNTAEECFHVSDDAHINENESDTILLQSRSPETMSSNNYVPWQSPNITRKRILERVRESPRLARRMLSKMTSPGMMRRKEEIFVVKMQELVMESGSCCNEMKGSSRMDSW